MFGFLFVPQRRVVDVKENFECFVEGDVNHAHVVGEGEQREQSVDEKVLKQKH